MPKTWRILSIFATASSNTIGTRVALETQSSRGFTRAATSSYRALNASPVASGSSVRRNSQPAIFSELTVTPGSKTGRKTCTGSPEVITFKAPQWHCAVRSNSLLPFPCQPIFINPEDAGFIDRAVFELLAR